jgi:hypothetical protein
MEYSSASLLDVLAAVLLRIAMFHFATLATAQDWLVL